MYLLDQYLTLGFSHKNAGSWVQISITLLLWFGGLKRF